MFDAVEAGRLSLPGVYPDTAAPTRRLVTAALWLVALAMAYPYVPGSESDGVKGIGVFVGLVLSLGSSGVVQHLMSGLMLTYARAVHVGDFAQDRRIRGNDPPGRRDCDQDTHGNRRGGHHSERRRRVADRHELLGRIRRRLRTCRRR